jgi:uncharacterized protein
MFYLIIIPLIVAVITQGLKLITDGIPDNLTFRHIISDYGGMPSSHTAFVASLATVVGLHSGFNSSAFAISFVLMIVVVRDAIGFRREIGKNAIFTNTIAKKVLSKKERKELLNEKMGHTIPQVLVGFISGVLLSIIIYVVLIGA